MSCHDVRHMHPRHSCDISSEDRHNTTRHVTTWHGTTRHDTTRHDPSPTRYNVSFVYHFMMQHIIKSLDSNRQTETLTFWWNFRAKSTCLYPILVCRILKDVVVKQSGIRIGSWLYWTWKDAAGTHVKKLQNRSFSLALRIVTFGGGHNLVWHVSFRPRRAAAQRQKPERLQALHGGHVLSLGISSECWFDDDEIWYLQKVLSWREAVVLDWKNFRAERESN